MKRFNENNFLRVLDQANSCYGECIRKQQECQVSYCRLWIDYPSDLNCTEVAVLKNDRLVLREIGDRLKLTPSRIKQIEGEALKKLVKTMESAFKDS
jgi:hypothetical protein